MPIYEYRCDKCEHIFEEVHAMDKSNKPLSKPCPECGVKKSVNKTFATGGAGVDVNKGPGSDYNELMKKMKGGLPKRYHERLDVSADRRAGRIGTQ